LNLHLIMIETKTPKFQEDMVSSNIKKIKLPIKL
jgi:hypothetical protein